MKKFLFFLSFLLLLGGGVYYAYYYEGVYIDFHPNEPVKAFFSTNGTTFLNHQEETENELKIKGVVMESTLPGFHFSDYKIEKNTYHDYLEDIHQMGANTVRVKMILNPAFYEAFLDFNETSDTPLYLIQGIGIEDYGQNNNGSLYQRNTFSDLIKLGKRAVDVVHGQANQFATSIQGSGQFRSDVSPYTLGYIIGDYWFEGTLAYTNQTQTRRTNYEGKYFKTKKDASDFEAMMAEVMDKMTVYESNKYKQQRLVSFISGPSMDKFAYTHTTRVQVDKHIEVDHEQIEPTDKLQSGYFAAYNMYPFIPDLETSLAETEIDAHAFIASDAFDSDSVYNGYVQLLTHTHTIPVLIANYGYFSARGVENSLLPQLTEKEQGEMLVDTYEQMVEQGVQGAIVSSWQDNWSLSSWNTEYATHNLQQRLWHDVQMPENNYGLLAFDPGRSQSISYPDGDVSEWTKEEFVAEQEGLRLYQTYDSSYVYFYVQGAKLDSGEVYYIPLDTTPLSGSKEIEGESIKADRPIDFLIRLDGEDNSRMLVQEYYNSTMMEYGDRIVQTNRFYRPPKKESSLFEPIWMVQKKEFDPDYKPLKMTTEEKIAYNSLPVFETGKLLYGNGNPTSPTYMSLADFYASKDGVEIRIPWQLLNMSDPSDLLIHGDYYEHYGVEVMPLKEMYVGVGKNEPIRMHEKKLKKYRLPTYHPRLKQSYYVLQEAWTK